MRPCACWRSFGRNAESRNAAAGGRGRHCGITAAVGESEEQRKPERFSGYRKAGRGRFPVTESQMMMASSSKSSVSKASSRYFWMQLCYLVDRVILHPNNAIGIEDVFMTLFVDETENEDFFIVTGLLVRSKEDVDLAYRKFKKGISGAHISNKLKQSLFTEFKSVQLDHHFQALKRRMLLEIMEFDNSIIYSCHVKKDKLFYQKKKEDVYILLLSKIVTSLESETDIIYDAFNKSDFEQRINTTIAPFVNVRSIKAMDSRLEAGLQFVDNVCSVIRLQKSDKDQYSYYEIIESRIKTV